MTQGLPELLKVTQLEPDLWHFNESMGSMPYVDAYLIVGQWRAALVDALMSELPSSLVQQIREITDLPVDILLTHGHPDHAGAEVRKMVDAEGFSLYLSHDDIPVAKSMFAPWFSEAVFGDLKEGDVFDLGGIELETCRVAGHTPGSMVFLDRAHRRCFTGDALGVWLQMDHSLPMAVYIDELKRFEKTLADIPETKLFIGHMSQAPNGYFTAGHVTNMREACELVRAGTLKGMKPVFPPEMADSPIAALMKDALIAEYKTVTGLTYLEDRL